jgi:uncharacterized protein (TIGR03437 family)
MALIAGPQDVIVEPRGTVLTAEAANVRIRRLTAPPSIQPEVSLGPVNWADGSARLSPGTIFLIRGSNLAVQEAARGEAPWPTEMGGARVLLNGEAVPLTRVSETEIAGMIPYSAAVGGGTMRVSRDGVLGVELPVTIEPAAPALLLLEPGRAIALNEDGSLNSAENPAAPESLLTVYLTGAGLTENPPSGGAGAGEESKPLLTVLLQFAEMTLEPVRVRLTPGRVGITEVQFRVPVNEAGDYPVAVRVGEVLSAPAQVSLGTKE